MKNFTAKAVSLFIFIFFSGIFSEGCVVMSPPSLRCCLFARDKAAVAVMSARCHRAAHMAWARPDKKGRAEEISLEGLTKPWRGLRGPRSFSGPASTAVAGGSGAGQAACRQPLPALDRAYSRQRPATPQHGERVRARTSAATQRCA